MARKRLLVVEDFQQLRELMQMVLHELGGHAVETAAGGEIARRLIAEQSFDLVVLDIGLPGALSGRDIAALIRARLGCPILFITGRDLAETGYGDLIGPNDRFLRKPFKMDVLVAEVAALLELDAPHAAQASKRAHRRQARSSKRDRSSGPPPVSV